MTKASADQVKLNQFLGKVLIDGGAAMSTILVLIGERLGLYKAMHEFSAPITSSELASRTDTSERYIREWLANQAASGYVTYDPQTGRYTLPPEHAMVLVDEKSPVFILGGFQTFRSFFKDEDKITHAFRTGTGIEWADHDPDYFEAQERFSTPIYTANLVNTWIPAIENGAIDEKLKQGGVNVADVGCGHGASTILMAKAYPNSKFIGFDNHKPSIEKATKKAQEEGLKSDKLTFEVANSTDFPGSNYDLVTFFDCLHDMGDPTGALTHSLRSIKADGTLMIVEPFANDKLEDNLNPIGRIFYAVSSMLCVPASLAYNGPALGAQAGEARISEIARTAGFRHFKRVSQTPFHSVYEVKP
jgi:SAM-dependent methyltransferase